MLAPTGIRSRVIAPSPGAGESAIASLRRYGELLSILASRTLKTRYRGSVLGIFWSLSNPLLMTGVYTLIFGSAFAVAYGNSILNYVFATFVGLSVLNIFSQTTSQALPSIVTNGGLLNKVRLPPSLFPISFVASNFYQFAVGTFPVLCILTIWNTHSALNVVALLIPSLALLLTTIGFSLLVSSLYVYFRDLPYMYEIITFFIWITSPIFYPSSMVPARVVKYLAVNPLIFTVGSFRQISLTPGFPDLGLAGQSLLSGTICAIVGALVFLARRHDFMDLL